MLFFKKKETEAHATDPNDKDFLIFGETYDEEKYGGGSRSFYNIDKILLDTLIRNNSTNDSIRPKFAPTAKEMLKFVERNDIDTSWTFDGRVISPRLSQSGVIITALRSRLVLDKSEAMALAEFAKTADELFAEPGRQGYAKWGM